MRPVSPALSLASSAKRLLFLLSAGAIILVTQSGCSVSRSISDSISSPFEWSSDSSGCSSDERESAYRNDIRDYTDAYIRSNHDAAGLRNGMASIAHRHGVSDWEADTASYVGIGAGLAKAEATPDQLARFSLALADGETQRSAIERGYRSLQ